MTAKNEYICFSGKVCNGSGIPVKKEQMPEARVIMLYNVRRIALNLTVLAADSRCGGESVTAKE